MSAAKSRMLENCKRVVINIIMENFMNNISINHAICKKCGLCAEVCPNKIIIKDKSSNEMKIRFNREELCFNCGQCMAICPAESISINGLSYEKNFFKLQNKNRMKKNSLI
jgi:NAD-dependent dihydropyrimidine dehydrogenase PreA subunit